MMKTFRYVLVALCLTLLSSHARSQTYTAYDLTTATAGPNYMGNQDFAGTVGMQFDVNSQAIKVTSLGVFDSNGNGFQHVLTTYLFDGDTHALLASETFGGTSNSTADTLAGYNRFKTLAGGLILQPGNYVIASDGFAGSDTLGNETIAGFVPDTFNNGGGLITAVGSGLYSEAYLGPGTYPTRPFGDDLAFNVGTFQYSLFVPEPGSVALMIGMIGVGGSFTLRNSRRRLKKIA